MEWQRIRTDPVTQYVYRPQNHITFWSYEKHDKWYLGVKIRDADDDGKWKVRFEGECTRCSRFQLRTFDTEIPPVNRITIFCEDCKEPMFRATGFINEEWRMEIPKE